MSGAQRTHWPSTRSMPPRAKPSRMTPLDRLGTADKVAASALFVASYAPAARCTLPVDAEVSAVRPSASHGTDADNLIHRPS